MSYVMLGTHRIDVPDDYMLTLGLVDGQAIDQAGLDELKKLSGAKFYADIAAIGNAIDRLRESRDELITAAKMFMAKQDRFRRDILQSAIDKAEDGK